MTWNESNHLGTWYLAPAGGMLTSGTIGLGSNGVVGNSTNVNLGNRDTQNRAISSPGNGALDEIAFWNRELTAAEVNAQFDTLKVLFQGPSKVFDLTRWELTLPVDESNRLDNTHMPLDVRRGWLNNGFKYVDPADAKQNTGFIWEFIDYVADLLFPEKDPSRKNRLLGRMPNVRAVSHRSSPAWCSPNCPAMRSSNSCRNPAPPRHHPRRNGSHSASWARRVSMRRSNSWRVSAVSPTKPCSPSKRSARIHAGRWAGPAKYQVKLLQG